MNLSSQYFTAMAMNSRTQISVFTIIISFLGLTQNVKSASFSFSSFGSYTNGITLEGDAYVSEGVIKLTPVTPNNAGRASFAAPIHLWDAETGKLASFNTTFSFVVAPNAPGLLADGIAFFLAPFNSNIPSNSSGGFLGLFSPESALNAYQNQIVAVEFDSFSGNPWDPPSPHVGIDVNSIASVTTEKWETDSAGNALVAYASVSYEAVEKRLDVVVRYPGSSVNETSLSFVIDLRTVLPQWVRVGFSGATGRLVEIHNILSWTFNSAFY